MNAEPEATTRAADAARHAVRAVALAFVVAAVGALVTIVAVTRDADLLWYGLGLGAAFGGMGYGLIAWSHRLMPSGGAVEERAELGVPAEREAAATAFEAGADRVGRRGLLGAMLAGSAGLTGLAALSPLVGLGDAPGDELRHTPWRGGGLRLVRDDGVPVRADELDPGEFVTVFPDGFRDRADAQTVLIKLEPGLRTLAPTRDDWIAADHVAYSKICTHAGCPVGLYETESNELFCPCHQSAFAVLEGARPTLGPANRPLPQLPLAVDDAGYLVATGDFPEAVGPGWWTRP